MANGEIKCLSCRGDLINKKQLLSVTKCGHGFHNKCIEESLKKSKTCPVCKAAVVCPAAFYLTFQNVTTQDDKKESENLKSKLQEAEEKMKSLKLGAKRTEENRKDIENLKQKLRERDEEIMSLKEKLITEESKADLISDYKKKLEALKKNTMSK